MVDFVSLNVSPRVVRKDGVRPLVSRPYPDPHVSRPRRLDPRVSESSRRRVLPDREGVRVTSHRLSCCVPTQYSFRRRIPRPDLQHTLFPDSVSPSTLRTGPCRTMVDALPGETGRWWSRGIDFSRSGSEGTRGSRTKIRVSPRRPSLSPFIWC